MAKLYTSPSKGGAEGLNVQRLSKDHLLTQKNALLVMLVKSGLSPEPSGIGQAEQVDKPLSPQGKKEVVPSY